MVRPLLLVPWKVPVRLNPRCSHCVPLYLFPFSYSTVPFFGVTPPNRLAAWTLLSQALLSTATQAKENTVFTQSWDRTFMFSRLMGPSLSPLGSQNSFLKLAYATLAFPVSIFFLACVFLFLFHARSHMRTAAAGTLLLRSAIFISQTQDTQTWPFHGLIQVPSL